MSALPVAVALAALAVPPTPARAEQAVLTWEAPTTTTDGSPLTDLAGYRVYVGTSPGNYHQTLEAGNQPIYLVDTLSPGNTYYFAVTAFNTSGEESVYSEEVVKSFPPSAGAPAATFTIEDALSALRYAVGLSTLTPAQLTQFDVAPLGLDGRPSPDQAVDVGDAVVILRRVAGVVNW